MSGELGLAGQPDSAVGRVREYGPLYRYLKDRYADRVVLTFAQIESLVGFPLPDSARRERDWWSGGLLIGRPSPQSESWTLASRTATVNLPARTVLFERVT